MNSAGLAFSTSHEGASVLVDAIHGVTEFSLAAHLDLLAKVCNNTSRRHEVDVQSTYHHCCNYCLLQFATLLEELLTFRLRAG